MFKQLLFFCNIIIFILLIYHCGYAGQKNISVHNPPFELYGEVRTVSADSLEIFVPHINKKITVMLMPETLIVSRMDDAKTPQKITVIGPDDLVQVHGVVKKDSFYCTKISYLSSSKTH